MAGHYGVVYDIESWTDMLPEFGGDTYTQTDVYMTGRTNGVATYRNSDFFWPRRRPRISPCSIRVIMKTPVLAKALITVET